MDKPIVSLTTDFGDSFACAQLELVINQINPDIKFILISKEIAPFSIIEGSFVLSNSYKLAPIGSLHIVVVDPEVGSNRRGIIIKTKNYWFVGPDNGVLYSATKEDIIEKVYVINEDKLNPHSSATFHGRDIFAKMVALISLGKNINYFTTELKSKKIIQPILKKNQIMHIDPYGNIKFNARPNGLKYGDKLKLKLLNKEITVPFVKTFAAVKKGGPLIYLGSHQTLELAINLGNAAKYFNLKIGDTISITQSYSFS